MAHTYYGLSELEYELMQYLWKSNHSLSFAEILDYCNNELHYDWAKTTLHTYLTRLIKKGVLHFDRKGYRHSYYPELTEQELAHKYATDFVDNSFGGSVSNLLISLTYNTELSDSDIEELKKIIDHKVSTGES